MTKHDMQHLPHISPLDVTDLDGGITYDMTKRTRSEILQERAFDDVIEPRPVTKVVVIRDTNNVLGLGRDLEPYRRAQQGGPGPEIQQRQPTRRRRWRMWFRFSR